MSSTVAARQTERVSASGGRLDVALSRLEVLAPHLLTVMILLWIAVMFVASYYKYETLGQGYDQVDFEQGIWNTLQGRIMEDSRFNFTGSVFGMDWMPMLLFFVPIYALVPSPHALFFLQIVVSGLGALPVYWLARDRLGVKLAALGIAAAYLLYPTLLHTALNPFQVRLFALTLLLFAFYFYERGNWQLFLALALTAMLARTDVALVVMMFGFYGLLTRRKWQFVVLPLAAGLGYFALSTFVITPSFAYPGALTPPPPGTTLDMSCWPCGMSPQLAYYAHLGRSGPEIAQFVLLHPIEAFNKAVIEPGLLVPKLMYLLNLVLPLALLPLLAPKPLVLGLPILALNLLSLRGSQIDLESHYSLLLVPGLVAAAIYGADNLRKRLSRWRDEGANKRLLQSGGVVLALWALLMTVPYANPVVRVIRFHEPSARVQAANELVGMVPRDAKVAVTSKLAPHLLPRRYIYNFPPAPYSPYNLGPHVHPGFGPPYVDLDYILADPGNESFNSPDRMIGGKNAIEFVQSTPGWTLEASKEGILLFKRQQ
ncbi:MAG: DUF2079 domain-containing protein [Chloroflexota bacterium]|nr:DUF2079 domain-containing protein [Chloroflexota bacterium]MDQ5866010.1 DUF2079 domain-containing protein [Chloroflexota bacterium]